MSMQFSEELEHYADSALRPTRTIFQFRSWCLSKLRFFEIFWFAAVVGYRSVITRIKFSENIMCEFRHPGLCSHGLVLLVLSSRSCSFALALFVSPRGVLSLRFRLRSLVFAFLISSCSCRRLGLGVLFSLFPLRNFWAYPLQKRVCMIFKFLQTMHWHGAKHSLWNGPKHSLWNLLDFTA